MLTVDIIKHGVWQICWIAKILKHNFSQVIHQFIMSHFLQHKVVRKGNRAWEKGTRVQLLLSVIIITIVSYRVLIHHGPTLSVSGLLKAALQSRMSFLVLFLQQSCLEVSRFWDHLKGNSLVLAQVFTWLPGRSHYILLFPGQGHWDLTPSLFLGTHR